MLHHEKWKNLSAKTIWRKKNNDFNPIDEDDDDLVLKPSEIIEKQFIDEYFLLTRRNTGMGLSLEQMWNMDYTIFSQLLDNEMKIIKAEQKDLENRRLEAKSGEGGKMIIPEKEDSPEYTDIYESLMVQ